MLRYLSSGNVIGVVFDSCMGSLLAANSLFFCMYILYDSYSELSTWNLVSSSGASGWNGAGFGANKGSDLHSRTVVELDLAVYTQLFIVYNSCTPCGMSRIEYLSVDIYIHVYTWPCSGAYYGPTVGTVEGLVAVDHREPMVDKYWQRHYLQDETTVDESFEHGSPQFF